MAEGAQADALVLFGASGDLARKKVLPALYNLVRHDRLRVPVVGVGRTEWGDADLVAHAEEGARAYGNGFDPATFARLARLLSYVQGDYNDPAVFHQLHAKLEGPRNPVYYLAVPPSLFAVVVGGLKASGCADRGRVVVEKPFGRDLASAHELNVALHDVFAERDVFRIDHYLGKEAVLNLLYVRFANSFLEPIWNRDHVGSIQVTLAESFGVEGRGSFYEEVGALRDVVENHLFNVVAMLAMEPPTSTEHDAMRDRIASVLECVRPLTPHDLVRGQFVGYRDEAGVAPDSDVETYVAVRLHIDNWRWAGVPILIRAGKRLPVTATEVQVELKPPPVEVFGDEAARHPNWVRFRLSPDTTTGIGAWAKQPGDDMAGRLTELKVTANDPDQQTAYERLLAEALEGDATLFAREDGVEAAWRVVDPILDDHPPAIPYEPGTWGPEQARRLTAADHWHDPL
ncbi:MAG: glucose-6-phosphate dehydrogenase [Acidimicrobiia bacterium]|nr:glucose-6-phosphate dehydrogenase [Acidimicrobiia bacterium]